MAPKKKRKYSSSVAAAARDALYSSSSDSSSEEEESESDDESEQSSSSSEEDEPIRKKKKVSASSKSNNTSSKHTSTKAKYNRRHLKPLFEKGDKVSSAWWKDEKRSGEPQWYPGSIKSYTEEETNSPYGPTRYYDIDFDDGDELYGVEDYYVFPEVDYILQQKNDFKPNWIGVKNVRDKSGKKDKSWASVVGWYVANLGDGKESEHARLSDAMDAYDNHIVQTKGKKTKKSELNRPNKWGWLFATSDSESEEDKKKRKRGKKKKKKKKEEEPSIRKKVKSVFEALAKPSAPPPPTLKAKEKSSKSPPPTKGLKTPSSNYKGVSYSKQDKKYLALIEYGGKLHSLGYYKLESDAALAYDKGSIVLLSDADSPNFSTRHAYEKAIKREAEEIDPSFDTKESYKDVVKKVEVYLSNIYAGEKKAYDMELEDDEGSEEDSDEDNSDEEMEDEEESEPTVKKKKGASVYTGVCFYKKSKKWRSSISHGSKLKQLGEYKLEADAALVYDEAAQLLRGPSAETNFDTLEDYEKAKKLELATTGLSSDVAMSPTAIKAKVTKAIRKTWPAASIQDGGSSKRESVIDPKKKTSNYVGVSYHKSTKKWVSQITHNNGTIKLGYFKLQADAAFAFDEAVKQLRGSTANTNFSSLEDYEKAKKQELRETGLGNDAAKYSAAITSEVLEALPLKYRASSSKKVTSAKTQSNGNKTFPAHQQSKQSDYIGVTYNNTTQSFESEIKHGRRKHHVGNWHLQSDAALAYDEACKLLNGEDCSNVNFASDQTYLDARSNEISKLFGSSVTIEPISSITSEIKRQLAKIPSPELDALNDAMAAKWSRYLPSVTGNDFMALYQKSMGKLLGMTTKQLSEQHDTSTSIVSDNAVTECAKDTEVPEGGFKPISDSRPKDTKSSQPQPEDESDDEASLFSGNDTEEEETDAVVNTSDKVKAGAQSVLDDNTASSTTKDEKPNTTEFPIGCPVMWNMNDDSFNCGTVSSKPTKGKQYEVVDGEKSNSKLVPGESLLFGIDCPVNVAPSCEDKSPLLQGKVLMYTNKSYTILINKEGNQIEVMTGVTQDRVTFRRVEEVESSAPQPNKPDHVNDEVQKETPPSQQPQVEKPRYDNDNSTITSLDSAQASSRRQLATGSIPRKQGDSVDCRIYFPHWLIPDTVSRQRLFSHLVDASNIMNLQKIGTKTNCTLRLIDDVTKHNPHVTIQTKQGKYAIDDMRKAASDLEDVLLEYVRHDGSQGRLFYDLAWKCKLLHPRGGAGSFTVQQRNPFSPNKLMGWVNIVKLPSIGEGSRKQYHSMFVIAKRSGVLRKVSQETGCTFNICSNEAKVPTHLCAPYIWVVGSQPARVDRAVEILQESIQQHMRECRCRL